MTKIHKFWVVGLILLFGGVLVSGCGGTPKLTLKPTSGQDLTGAMKYQLWTGYIHVAAVQTKGKDNPGVTPEFDLNGEVARNPYKPIILIEGRDEFFGSTKLTYAPVKNTMLPEKVTVEVEDKTEKRIEQAGAILKPLGLLFLSAPEAKDMDLARIKEPYQLAIASFERWTVNLIPALNSGKLTKDKISLNKDTGIGQNPPGWVFTLDIEPVSATAVNISEMDSKKYAELLDSLGSRGVLIYPSCRASVLTLTHENSNKKWMKSFQIPDPQWVETIKLPIKGSMIFNECSVAVEPGDLDRSDSFAYAVKLAETAKDVWDSWEAKKKPAEDKKKDDSK